MKRMYFRVDNTKSKVIITEFTENTLETAMFCRAVNRSAVENCRRDVEVRPSDGTKWEVAIQWQ